MVVISASGWLAGRLPVCVCNQTAPHSPKAPNPFVLPNQAPLEVMTSHSRACEVGGASERGHDEHLIKSKRQVKSITIKACAQPAERPTDAQGLDALQVLGQPKVDQLELVGAALDHAVLGLWGRGGDAGESSCVVARLVVDVAHSS